MNEILLPHFMEKYFARSQFLATNEITIHERKKQAISNFMGK